MASNIPSLSKWITFGALLVALAFVGVAAMVRPVALLDLLATFSGTLVSATLAVAGGIWLFHYQTSINDERERTRLQTMLAVEVQLNINTLEERPAEMMNVRTGEALGQAVLVPLPIPALEQLIHSGLEDPEVALQLMRLAAHIRVHNSEVSSLLAVRGGPPVATQSVAYMTAELNQRQQELKDVFNELLDRLREAGIEPPARTS